MWQFASGKRPLLVAAPTAGVQSYSPGMKRLPAISTRTVATSFITAGGDLVTKDSLIQGLEQRIIVRKCTAEGAGRIESRSR